tara:strand:- start:649 stop:1137 length:489 start_codon:yes stop_codon:yes gene_type:complete
VSAADEVLQQLFLSSLMVTSFNKMADMVSTWGTVWQHLPLLHRRLHAMYQCLHISQLLLSLFEPDLYSFTRMRTKRLALRSIKKQLSYIIERKPQSPRPQNKRQLSYFVVAKTVITGCILLRLKQARPDIMANGIHINGKLLCQLTRFHTMIDLCSFELIVR